MEQLNYKMEILLELLRDKNHIRGLAKLVKTNHMNIKRRVDELFENNVLDYKEEGKNKTYFIKNSEEARINVMIAEHYKLLKLLKKYPEIRSTIEKLEKTRVDIILIFGSYAKFIAKEDSDIDIFMKTNKRKIKTDLEITDSKLSIKIGEYDKNSPLGKEIEKNHVILRGAEDYYEKLGFFS